MLRHLRRAQPHGCVCPSCRRGRGISSWRGCGGRSFAGLCMVGLPFPLGMEGRWGLRIRTPRLQLVLLPAGGRMVRRPTSQCRPSSFPRWRRMRDALRPSGSSQAAALLRKATSGPLERRKTCTDTEPSPAVVPCRPPQRTEQSTRSCFASPRAKTDLLAQDAEVVNLLRILARRAGRIRGRDESGPCPSRSRTTMGAALARASKCAALEVDRNCVIFVRMPPLKSA